MRATCAQIFALIVLVNTNLAIIIAFATPYWIEWNWVTTWPQHWLRPENQGLWAECGQSSCRWVFDNDFLIQKTYPDWFKACQALMAIGLAAGLTALLVATLGLCCECHSCNPNHPVCGLLVIAFLTMGVAITIFGIKASNDWHIEFQWSYSSAGRFGWSFWVAIAAAASSMVTASFYGCMGRKGRS